MSQSERSENQKVANMQVAGRILLELRSSTGLTLRDMSVFTGKDFSHLSKAERGLTRTTDAVLDAYFEAADLNEHARIYNETVIKLMWGQAPRNLTLEEIRAMVEILEPSRAERYKHAV